MLLSLAVVCGRLLHTLSPLNSLGITFSTIFSGTRGSIGLMSIFWAAFSVCVFIQSTNPEKLPLAMVAYPRRRMALTHSILFAGIAPFIGIVLMGITVATLDLTHLRNENAANQIDTRISAIQGGYFLWFWGSRMEC